MSSVEAFRVASLRPGSTVSGRPCGFTGHRFPTFLGVGSHPPSSFSSSSACSSDRLLPVLAGLVPCDCHPVCQRAPSLGFLPSSRRQSRQFERGLPLPRSGSSPGFPGWNLPFQALRPWRFTRLRRFAPPSTLRACFVPLPRSGFRSSGVSPSAEAVSGFHRTSALLSFLHESCGLTRSVPMAVNFRALLPS